MVVMLGIVIVLIPEFMKKEGGAKEEVGENQSFWIFIQIASIVPSVFSSVYKEKVRTVCEDGVRKRR